MSSLMRPRSLWALWLAVVAALATWLAATRWGDMSALVDDLSPGPLVVLVAASCLLLVPNAAFWTLALRSLGERAQYGTVLHASARALLTRYVPGGIWYAAGRGTLLKRHGVSVAASATVGGLELALGAPVAIVVGAVLLAASGAVAPWIGVGAVVVLHRLRVPVEDGVKRVLGQRDRPRADRPVRRGRGVAVHPPSKLAARVPHLKKIEFFAFWTISKFHLFLLFFGRCWLFFTSIP